MTIHKFLLWFTMMAPLAYSAGPNNILCASLSSRFGIKSIIPFIAGMNTTVLVATIAVGYSFSKVIESVPELFTYIKYIGSGFIVLLAFKFFRTFEQSDKEARKSLPGFFEGILLNALNPKAVMGLAVMYSQFLDSSLKATPQIIILSFSTFIMSVTAHFLWASGGNWIRVKFQSTRALQLQRYIFSVMLVGVAVILIFI